MQAILQKLQRRHSRRLMNRYFETQEAGRPTMKQALRKLKNVRQRPRYRGGVLWATCPICGGNEFCFWPHSLNRELVGFACRQNRCPPPLIEAALTDD